MLEIALLQLEGIAQTVGDLSFVITLMAFVYVVYNLFVAFNENQMIFIILVLISAYLMIFSPLLMIGFGIFFLFINPQVINNLAFGLGFLPQNIAQTEQILNEGQMKQRMETVENKLQQGQAVDPQELAMYNQAQAGAQQQGMGSLNQQLMRRIR